jgi:hypothetical protein
LTEFSLIRAWNRLLSDRQRAGVLVVAGIPMYFSQKNCCPGTADFFPVKQYLLLVATSFRWQIGWYPGGGIYFYYSLSIREII